MSRIASLAAVFLAAIMPPLAEAQNWPWQDNLDSYATGSPIAGQGGWETWDNNPAFNTIVTNATVLSPPNSLLVSGPAHVIRRFVMGGPAEGDLFVRVYIPSTQTGEVWLRVPNTYAPGGPYGWSIQLVMCVSACTTPGAIPGQIVNVGGIGSAALLTDQWAEIHLIYNLPPPGNYAIAYNGGLFAPFQPWSGTGVFRAVEVFSNNSSPAYMDNFDLFEFVPVELTTFTVD